MGEDDDQSMWNDYDYHQNTDELPEYFDDEDDDDEEENDEEEDSTGYDNSTCNNEEYPLTSKPYLWVTVLIIFNIIFWCIVLL